MEKFPTRGAVKSPEKLEPNVLKRADWSEYLNSSEEGGYKRVDDIEVGGVRLSTVEKNPVQQESVRMALEFAGSHLKELGIEGRSFDPQRVTFVPYYGTEGGHWSTREDWITLPAYAEARVHTLTHESLHALSAEWQYRSPQEIENQTDRRVLKSGFSTGWKDGSNSHDNFDLLNEAIYYDLADKQWQAVKVTAQEWRVVRETPILFKRYQHHAAQVVPVGGGQVQDLLRFINITERDHQILVLVYLVSCFMPGFAHPIPYIYGQQGSAKSTFSKVLRKLIDPSRLEVLSLPRKPEELTQVLAHHWFLFFDNVSYISHDTSDLLCRAVTGSGFSKRQLYTDDEDIIYNIQPNIGINGINLASAAPDLLERSMLIELKRVEVKDRKDERELWRGFEEERPKLLGAIFDAVAKTIATRKTITLTSLPRMADFVLVGCAIAEAIGYSRDEFLQAYYRNINSQNEEVLAEHLEAMLVSALLDNQSEWSGSPAQLLEVVRAIGKEQSIDEKQLPKSANALSRKLNILKTNLETAGIKLIKSKGTKRTITLQRAAESVFTADTAQTDQESQSPTDDSEDATDPLRWFDNLAETKVKDDKDGKDDV